MENQQDPRTMTADTIGKDLLSALVTELKLLPKPWPELSNGKQDDTIDRPGGVNITHLGNGWRRVTFGRDWRAGKGLSGRVPLCGIQSRMSMTVMAV